MRITTEAKAATEDRILRTAARLFTKSGWDQTTTREIASEAGIATGTLFNYFESKETIAAALISLALAKAQEEFDGQSHDDDSLAEILFSLIWTGLRSLRPYRKFLPEAAETMFSPLARLAPDRPGDSIRVHHLETVERILRARGIGPVAPVKLQLYWTLYLGIIGAWALDDSPHQEDTLALLDQSVSLFVAALRKKS